jgi:hypothetical protein
VIGQIAWYEFPATANTTYTLTWDSLYDGTNAYNGWVDVWAFSGDGAYLDSGSDGYFTPLFLGVGSDDTIYVRVEDKGHPGAGSYAIRYHEITGGDGYYFFILSPDSNTLTVNIMNRGNGETEYLPNDPECDTWVLQNDENKGTFPIGKWVKGEEYILFPATGGITVHSPGFTDRTGIIYRGSMDTTGLTGEGELVVLWN